MAISSTACRLRVRRRSRSGTWCLTAWCSTSPSTTCTTAGPIRSRSSRIPGQSSKQPKPPAPNEPSMSQEQPPIRSRRELRQARDERQDVNPGTGTSGAGAVPAARDGSAQQAPAPGRAARIPPSPTPRNRPRPKPPAAAASPARWTRSGPPPAPNGPPEHRARDRAALRTIKELAEKEGKLSPGGPPTRRHVDLQLGDDASAKAALSRIGVAAGRENRNMPDLEFSERLF